MSEVIGWTSCWAPARCRLPKGHLSVSSPHFYVGTSNDEEDRLRARIAELEALLRRWERLWKGVYVTAVEEYDDDLLADTRAALSPPPEASP